MLAEGINAVTEALAGAKRNLLGSLNLIQKE